VTPRQPHTEPGAEEMSTPAEEALRPLLEQAEREDKLLRSTYDGDIVMTAKELRAANAEGRFRWGPVNWTLITVDDYLRGFDASVERAQQERTAAYRKVGRST
jgi:hypothetical protein